MLVLSRKPGEEIVCTLPDGQHLVIVVGATKARGTRLCFSAPRGVRIMRGEIAEQCRESRGAGRESGDERREPELSTLDAQPATGARRGSPDPAAAIAASGETAGRIAVADAAGRVLRSRVEGRGSRVKRPTVAAAFGPSSPAVVLEG